MFIWTLYLMIHQDARSHPHTSRRPHAQPSTGLDPASRHTLWEVVRGAKRGRGVILTTHSMEEAAVLVRARGGRRSIVSLFIIHFSEPSWPPSILDVIRP